MKKLLLSVLLFLAFQPIFATSIVVLITPDYILLATDSKRNIIDDQTNTASYLTVCKIRNLNDYCYTMAGLVASANTNFSADSIINHYLKNTKNYRWAISQIQQSIATSLEQDLAYKKTHSPETFKKITSVKDPMLEVVLLCTKNGAPYAEVIGFQLSGKSKTRIKTYTSSSEKNIDGHKILMVGQYSEMESFLQENKQNSPVTLVEQMILAQSEATPSSVGTPVSIIKYTAKGVEWIK